MMWRGQAPRGVVWLAVAGLLVGIAFSAMMMTKTPGIRVFVPIVPIFIFGIPFIAFVMRRAFGRKSPSDRAWTAHVRGEKPKRGEEDLADMLWLLDEDELSELHQRLKRRLVERIDGGSDEEVESFEQLLSSRERQKRK